MKAVSTTIPDVQLLEPRVFEDNRGSFFESYNERVLADLGPGQPVIFP
jgi:dTDP-4-dehydrorhamnose 3,5-epimerase